MILLQSINEPENTRDTMLTPASINEPAPLIPLPTPYQPERFEAAPVEPPPPKEPKP